MRSYGPCFGKIGRLEGRTASLPAAQLTRRSIQSNWQSVSQRKYERNNPFVDPIKDVFPMVIDDCVSMIKISSSKTGTEKFTL